jgi:hypothetical protein
MDDERSIESIRNEISTYDPKFSSQIMEKILIAALSSIPWVGGFLSTIATIKTDQSGLKTNRLQTKWIEEHEKKIQYLLITLSRMEERFGNIGESINERLSSEEYLGIVRKSFKVWDETESRSKREYIANLLISSGGSRISTDDVVSLFIDWLDVYHDFHFMVIGEIFSNPGITRYEIWNNLKGDVPRDDSAEADLFKLLTRDLSLGGVIRQPRDTTEEGRFKRKVPVRRRRMGSGTMESAFEDSKPYVLTELGQQFVHYTMIELAEQIEGK